MVLWPLQQIFEPFVLAAYDKFAPVASMDADIVGRGVDYVDVHVYGVKTRQCKYMQTQSFIRVGPILKDAVGRRIDIPELGGTKPLGNFDIGIWRVSPIAGGSDVLMFVQHDCKGRAVLTKIADLKL